MSEEEREPIVIHAYNDGEYSYSLYGNKYKDLLEMYLLQNGAKKDYAILEYYQEFEGRLLYYTSKKPINFTIFCNVSIVWHKSFKEFLEYCEEG
jgi:hypothetical protein